MLEIFDYLIKQYDKNNWRVKKDSWK
jgi:hypothetical protein